MLNNQAIQAASIQGLGPARAVPTLTGEPIRPTLLEDATEALHVVLATSGRVGVLSGIVTGTNSEPAMPPVGESLESVLGALVYAARHLNGQTIAICDRVGHP